MRFKRLQNAIKGSKNEPKGPNRPKKPKTRVKWPKKYQKTIRSISEYAKGPNHSSFPA